MTGNNIKVIPLHGDALTSARGRRGFTPLEVQGRSSLGIMPKAKAPLGSSDCKTDVRSRLLTGFTLFELTVALGIFSFVALAVVGVFVASLRIHRQSSAARAVIDNVRFALEFVEREMRTGRQFRDAGVEIEFVNDRGKVVRYRMGSDALERFNQESALYERLTASDAVISGFGFRLAGETPGDTVQPRVSLFFKASSRLDPTIVLAMETTVSQRELDTLK